MNVGHRRCAPIYLGIIISLEMLGHPFQFAEARPAQRHPTEERIAATCIARSAAGRAWLEKTLWGLLDQEGGWIGAEVANRDGSHDLGPLQINSGWVPRLAALTGQPDARVRQWLKQDACFNIDAARWIFISALHAKRDYWKAIGTYHSSTTWRQQRYAAAISLQLQHRFGATVFRRPTR